MGHLRIAALLAGFSLALSSNTPASAASASTGRPNGSECSVNQQCLSQRCVVVKRTTGVYWMKCVPPDATAKTGEYCGFPQHCQNKNCVNEKCSPPAALGEACISHEGCISRRCDGSPLRCIPPDGTGRLNEYCAHNNHCQNRSCVGLKCAAPPSRVALGGWCSGNANCVSGRCDGNSGAERQKCIPRDGTGEAGAYCSHPHHCRSGECASQQCGGTSKGSLTNGTRCKNNSDCQSGHCDNAPYITEPKCVAAPGTAELGSFCNASSQCKSFACSPLSSRTPRRCVPPFGNGQSCTEHRECESRRCGLLEKTEYSYTNGCVPNGNGKSGEVCTDHAQCASAHCRVAPGRIAGQCTASGLALGQSCSTHQACASGLCDARSTAGCVPRGNGKPGDICTDHGQCTNRRCAVAAGKIAGKCA